MRDSWQAPPPTAEQERAAELKAAGLRRGFMGRVEPIPESIVPADFVKRLDDQVKAGTLTYEGKQRAIGAETMRLYAAQIEEAHQRGVAEAAAYRERMAAEAEAVRQETRRLFDEAVTQRAEAWRRFEAASGRNLDGVSLADRATFDREWTAHMARKAITDATATA